MAQRAKTRPPLTRERILEAALELADESGVETLTMRGLGQALGFEAMSLYNHVANKDDVLDGILDLVLAEAELPEDGDWEPAVRTFAVSIYRAMRRHTWASKLLLTPGRIRPRRLQQMDALLGRLTDAGFTPEQTYTAYHVLEAHIFGFSLWQTAHDWRPADVDALVERFAQTISDGSYPNLAEHARQHTAEGPHQEVSAFELGLDLILHGLKRSL